METLVRRKVLLLLAAPAVTALLQRSAEYGVDVVGTDDIGTASTDDMFAFSQIVSAGQNPMAVANQIEKDI